MDNPRILGRMADDDITDAADPRADTKLVGMASVPYTAGAVGETTVELFRSTDQEDRGGIVLRISTEDEASSFVAHAVQREDGVEIHVAGEAESEAFIKALRAVLGTF